MQKKQIRLVTAESVRRGHPDKVCDQIADAILDEHLRQDPDAHVAVEVLASAGKIVVAGEVTSKADVLHDEVVRRVLRKVHYRPEDLCGECAPFFQIETRISEQSEDIHTAVGSGDKQGAGDQGIMVGYATNETREMLPLPVVLAHKLCRMLDEYQADWLLADGKVQVTVAYEGDKPLYIQNIVVSVQHDEKQSHACVVKELLWNVIYPFIPFYLLSPETTVMINPSRHFVKGGPAADTGLTGRKLAVDQYGPAARMGGGALSGKDPSKVDRSGAYMARYIAKNIVAAGLASRCEVQLAYAIGCAKPVSVSVDTFSTGDDAALEQLVRKNFDLTPAGIIRQLELRKPQYEPVACYGHYGRNDLDLPWERTDRKDDLRTALLTK